MRLSSFTFAMVVLLVVITGRAADLSDKETQAAQKIYHAKCAKCHKFYEPTEYSDEEWRAWMVKMTKKSKLKPDQAELLSRYLDTVREGGKAGVKPHK